jgi:hypothetical protein
MTTSQGESVANTAETLTSGTVSATAYAFPLRPSNVKFQGWHRPRKQFIRVEQWTHFIKTLLDEIKLQDGALSYFGLPGLDLLDLRYFNDHICEPRSVKLKFLGFNSEAQPGTDEDTALNLAIDELSRRPTYDPASDVVRDDLQSLVHDESLAWQKILDLGPFDVLNLDLCDGFGKLAPGQISQNYYDAVAKLLTVQARRTSPWLLFLTTRVGARHVHPTTLQLLIDVFNSNLIECESFQTASTKVYDISNQAQLNQQSKSAQGLQTIFLIGICKWLLKMSTDQKPQSSMELKNVMGYKVKPESPVEDMVSLALKFTPQHGVAVDSFKLASLPAKKLDECELASSVIMAMRSMLDVDAYLAECPEIFEQMIAASSEILSAAGYDVSGYRKFAVS